MRILMTEFYPCLLVCVFKSCLTLCDPMDCSPTTRLFCPWNFPDKNTRVGCHFLLQGIFPTQGLNPHLLRLLHWEADSLPLSFIQHVFNSVLLEVS